MSLSALLTAVNEYVGDTLVNEFAAIPHCWPSWAAVTIVTPVGKAPITARNVAWSSGGTASPIAAMYALSRIPLGTGKADGPVGDLTEIVS